MTEVREVAIEVKGLLKTFKNQVAVNDLDLTIYKGEVFGILGPNGAGKTTMVRMMATLLKQDAGTIRILGQDTLKDADEVRKLIGLTGQYASVDEDLTAHENLMMFCRLNGLSKKDAKARTTDLLEEFSLTDAAHKKMKNFSGGMRRRLDLAVSLIARPDIIFLDEPTTGLDPRTRGQMWETIRKLVEAGSTILLTTQYLDEADQLADRIAVIDRGSLVALGTPDELKNLIGNTELHIKIVNRRFLEDARIHISAILNVGTTVDDLNNTIKAPITETKFLTQVLNRLEEAKIKIDEVSIKKPSLDEVFLEVTGN
ncbi:MAG: ATP-binding cassette domain-containing protein [Turicibacter sp.]|nr:ATP-binding cassette domain-containing protein [Turicibacter sp.]